MAISVSALLLGVLAQTIAIRPLFIGLGVTAITFGLAWTAVTRALWTATDPKEHGWEG